MATYRPMLWPQWLTKAQADTHNTHIYEDRLVGDKSHFT